MVIGRISSSLQCPKYGEIYVVNYIKKNEIKYEGKGSLSTLARAVGVYPVVPKHNPVNDARTLFNILSKILIINMIKKKKE
mgnify:CR=1 FL=1